MSGRPSRPQLPRKGELLDVLDQHERDLSGLIGRWHDSITAAVRAELHALRAPLEELLIRARRRP